MNSCSHISCAPNNLPLACLSQCCRHELEKQDTRHAHVRLRNVAANHALAMKPRKREKKAMYPVINAIWYFAIPCAKINRPIAEQCSNKSESNKKLNKNA
jgi:hypothetical protein